MTLSDIALLTLFQVPAVTLAVGAGLSCAAHSHAWLLRNVAGSPNFPNRLCGLKLYPADQNPTVRRRRTRKGDHGEYRRQWNLALFRQDLGRSAGILNRPLKITTVRRKKSPVLVQRGCVPMRGPTCLQQSARSHANLGWKSGAIFHPIFTRVRSRTRNILIVWRSLRDSNPCYSLERAGSPGAR